MKAHSIGTKGQGWHRQSVRHSNARKTGTAGGKYAPVKITMRTYDAEARKKREAKLEYKKELEKYVVVDGTSYRKETSPEVIKVLGEAQKSRERLRFRLGDVKTGRDWGDDNERGVVGRSTGSIKIPLLIKTSRSSGGGALPDDAIVKIVGSNGRTLYQHPAYYQEASK